MIFLKKDKNILLPIIVTVFIISFIILIFYLDNYSNSSSKLVQKTNLIGYDKLKEKITTLPSINKKIGIDKNYEKMLKRINNLEINNLSKDQQYAEIEIAQEYLLFAYADTNDHNLYILEESFNDFVNTNFADKKIQKHKPSCFDPLCADSPQPKEILAIIEELKISNAPANLKESSIHDLANFGYLNKEETYSKAGDYLLVAGDIKNNKEYKAAGINLKIYQEITDYVKKAFPDEYKKLQPQ